VTAEICKCLGVPQLHRKQLWLMELPDRRWGVQKGRQMRPHLGAFGVVPCEEVWMVVCLAALQAMWVTGQTKCHAGPNIRAALRAAQLRGLHAAVVVDSAVAAYIALGVTA
jgi:hypothetical protein